MPVFRDDLDRPVSAGTTETLQGQLILKRRTPTCPRRDETSPPHNIMMNDMYATTALFIASMSRFLSPTCSSNLRLSISSLYYYITNVNVNNINDFYQTSGLHRRCRQLISRQLNREFKLGSLKVAYVGAGERRGRYRG